MTNRENFSALNRQEEQYVVAAFYRFVPLPDYQEIRKPLLDFCNEHNMKGTILLAAEGINSTISAARADMDAFFAYLDNDPRLANMERKEHVADFRPFSRMKVRLKKEIVRLGVDNLDMSKIGEYIEPKDWDKFIANDEVVVVDTRNHYEVLHGKFKGAVDPMTEEFRSFPEWVNKNLDPKKHKKVAMYCTGGIRCEKSTSLLKNMGFDEVYHLKGGILQYLADTENKSGMWEGECFVFDDRISVDAKLAPAKEAPCKECGAKVAVDNLKVDENHRGIVCEECLK